MDSWCWTFIRKICALLFYVKMYMNSFLYVLCVHHILSHCLSLWLSMSGGLQPPLPLWDPQTYGSPPSSSSSQFTSRPSNRLLGPPPPCPGPRPPWWPTLLHTGPTLVLRNGTRPDVPLPPRPLPLHSGHRERRQSLSESCTTSSPTRSSGSTASSTTTPTWETWTPCQGCCWDK